MSELKWDHCKVHWCLSKKPHRDWQEKTVDLCFDCSIKLNNAVCKAQADFINEVADNEQREAEN